MRKFQIVYVYAHYMYMFYRYTQIILNKLNSQSTCEL